MTRSILNSACFILYIFLSFVLIYIYYQMFNRQKLIDVKTRVLLLLWSSSFFIILSIILFSFHIFIYPIGFIIIIYTLVCVFFINKFWLRYIRKIPLDLMIYDTDDLIIVLDNINKIIYLNNAVLRLFPNENVSDLSTNPISKFLPEIIEVTSEKTGKTVEIVINLVQYSIKMYTKMNNQGKFISKGFCLKDISQLTAIREQMIEMKDNLGTIVSERTQELERTNAVLLKEIDDHRNSEIKLQSSLEEKSILLSEVHHRVKNNLQVIISLLKLQSRYIDDQAALIAFNTAVSRIRSISMIHEKLYKSDNLSDENFAEYIQELAQYLISAHRGIDTSINLIVNVENIFLDIDASVLCGLIINELIINILKYAFPECTPKNEIRINFLSKKNDENSVYGTGFGFELTISDNGIGVPEDLEIEKSNTLGFKIIHTLVKQLKGTISVKNDNGTVVKINF